MDPRLASLDRLSERSKAFYEQRGWWGAAPLWSRVRQEALSHPDKPAIIDSIGALTYSELWQNALRCREAMRGGGLGPRDIVLVQLPNWHEFIVLAVAAETLGVVLAFCPIQWGLHETVRALDLIRPSAWLTTTAPRPNDDRSLLIRQALSALVSAPEVVLARSSALPGAREFEDWCLRGQEVSFDVDENGASGPAPLEIAVTSGSTGDPKAVLHLHNSAIAAVQSTIRRQGICARDVLHLAVPVGHTFGYFYGVRCALQASATLVLQEKWDAQQMVELAERYGITVSLGPSAFTLDLLDCDDRTLALLKSLRFFTLAGDSLPSPTVQRAVARFPFRISRAFGMTEFGHATSTDAATPPECIVDSLGTPQPEVELCIADDANRALPANSEGRIRIRGPFLFAGYLTSGGIDQDVLDGKGYFDTGDLGFLDNQGFLHLTGRVKNILRRGAETVPVRMLEDLIARLPDVLHAVVIGVPDARLGEIPVACVQARHGKLLTLQQIEHLLQTEGVTKKFWPSELRLISEWPLGPTGKIDRRQIIARLLAEKGLGVGGD